MPESDTSVSETPSLTLPMSKIKKIVKLDPEHVSSTESANYLLGMATEMFIMELTHDASLVTKTKKRRKIMYADFQKAVSMGENYAFMRDIVPKRVPIGELVQNGKVKLSEKSQERILRESQEGGVMNLDDLEGDIEELDSEILKPDVEEDESEDEYGDKDLEMDTQ
ncbi:hypothetical protein DAMA08_025310 [Martiniozyma asiatica (nom. inval.)]|nr:hypothetical protein DAMA08_025310 [Martiniozyma asiatica]